MQRYSSLGGKEVYHQLQSNPEGIFPITAALVDGIIQDFVFGHYDEWTWYTNTIKMEISWEILRLSSWEERRNKVQEILNSTIQSKKVA